MDPVLDEILRAHLPIQAHVLRRWQQHIRDVVRPKLEAAEAEAQLAKRARRSEVNA